MDFSKIFCVQMSGTIVRLTANTYQKKLAKSFSNDDFTQMQKMVFICIDIYVYIYAYNMVLRPSNRSNG